MGAPVGFTGTIHPHPNIRSIRGLEGEPALLDTVVHRKGCGQLTVKRRLSPDDLLPSLWNEVREEVGLEAHLGVKGAIGYLPIWPQRRCVHHVEPTPLFVVKASAGNRRTPSGRLSHHQLEGKLAATQPPPLR